MFDQENLSNPSTHSPHCDWLVLDLKFPFSALRSRGHGPSAHFSVCGLHYLSGPPFPLFSRPYPRPRRVASPIQSRRQKVNHQSFTAGRLTSSLFLQLVSFHPTFVQSYFYYPPSFTPLAPQDVQSGRLISTPAT